MAAQEEAIAQAPLIASITKVKRVIFGHTHREMHIETGSVEVINVGTWSPAFKDPECKESYGKKCFAWIKPDPHVESGVNGSVPRIAELYEWKDPGMIQVSIKK